MSWPEIRRSIPNALTIARFAAIPVFVWLYLEAGDGPAWGAGVFFAAAALTDQLDGYLARRWQVESRFGTVADPLADRLMIGTAAILMLATGRIPIFAALVILARDVVLVLGYKILSPEGYDLEVTFLGRRRRGSSTPRSGSSSSRRRERPGHSCCCGSASRSPSEPACSTRFEHGARCTAEGTLDPSANLDRRLKSQPEVDPLARLLLYSGDLRGKAGPWKHSPISRH